MVFTTRFNVKVAVEWGESRKFITKSPLTFCRTKWTNSPQLAPTLGFTPTRRKQKSCTNLLQRKHTEQTIRVNGEKLNAVEKFAYLGSTI